ncbi:MAG: hypothetical protein NCW75_02930 [Phycisphaera sp.]|nr:MAG: hypothetical protein NCW75_02930 [Phycisphaera sp.]
MPVFGKPWRASRPAGDGNSARHTDPELAGFIMKARIFSASELRRACKVLGVWERGDRKAELRDHLRDALGTTVERPDLVAHHMPNKSIRHLSDASITTTSNR